MYICLDCGRIFSQPKRFVETHGFTHPPYEEWYGCDYCGGSYAETYECDGCGKLITDTYVKIDDEKYCQNCYTIVDFGED